MPVESIAKKLSARGFSDSAVAALLGNIDVETGGSFDYTQKQGGKGKGYGLFQFDWWKPRYEKWLKTNKLTDSADSQIDFFHDTIYGSNRKDLGYGTAAKLRDALANETDVNALTKTLSTLWFKPGAPHTARRQQSAQKYESLLSPQEPSPPTSPLMDSWFPQDMAQSTGLENPLLSDPIYAMGKQKGWFIG